MNPTFRKATLTDSQIIWQILQQAIERRRLDGSNQWQDGYPNLSVVESDINKGNGFVLEIQQEIVAYCAMLINDEPEYEKIEGKWLSNHDFVVFHRVAIADSHLGKGLAKVLFNKIEEFALNNKINSVKADTNFDNHAMLHLFKSLGYVYCGEVYFRGSPRKAYEKLLK